MTSNRSITPSEHFKTLEARGVRWTLSWLRGRLSGADPLISLDLKSDEDPEDLVAALLEEEGPSSSGGEILQTAVVRLLEQLRPDNATIPPYPSLLRLCRRAYIPRSTPWFESIVREAASNDAGFQLKWSSQAPDLLYAAVRQSPGNRSDAPTHDAWLQLLDGATYSSIALFALGTSPQDQICYWDRWWRAAGDDDKASGLPHLISAVVRSIGYSAFRERINVDISTYALTSAIEAALVTLGLSSEMLAPSPGTSVRCAIAGAAKKRDLVLAPMAA